MQRVAIVGHTGRSNYGHFLDRAFVGVEGARIIAVADPDETGRGAAVARTGAPTGYADYREMLERERPDITVFASREIGDHCELVTTAGESRHPAAGHGAQPLRFLARVGGVKRYAERQANPNQMAWNGHR